MILSGGTTTLGVYDFKAGLDEFGKADYWSAVSGGYPLNKRVMLLNGDIVKSWVNSNTVDPNIDMSQWIDANIEIVDSVEDLSKVSVRNGKIVYVKSYYSGLNKGGCYRTYVASQSAVNDDFLCINGWVLAVQNDTVTPEQAGCYGDNTNDDYTNLQKTFNSGHIVQMSGVTYLTTQPVEIPNKARIKGVGAEKTIIRKTGTAVNVNSVDCAAFINGSSGGYYGNLDLDGFSVVNESSLATAYGLYGTYVMRSKFSNIYAIANGTGVFMLDVWMADWTRVEGTAKIPFHLDTGTSNVFKSCWARVGKTYAWRLHNLTYSSLIGCAADYTGDDGSPAESVYRITNSDISLINCGAEQVHAYNIVSIDYSWVNISNPSFIYGVNNKYRHATRTGLFDISNADSVLHIIGGRVATANTGTYADPVRVGGATLTYDKPLWVGVGMPDDVSSTFKIAVTSSYVVDIKSYDGKSFTGNNRDNNATCETRTKFSKGILPVNWGLNSLNDMRKYVYFSYQDTAANGTTGRGYPVNNFVGSVINLSDLDVAQYSNTVQIAAAANTNDLHWRRAISGDQMGTWMEIWHTGNTTVDGSGFVKAASPIVKLFSDHIEINEEAKFQPITFEKLGVGDYLIKGTTGFSNDGWYIEIPSDANGNKLFAVVYTTLENWDISVKTYKKKFDYESASIVADLENPVDIKEGRWIDIRLNEVN